MHSPPRAAAIHWYGSMPGVFAPGDWQSTAWAVDAPSRGLHIALHQYEADTLALASLGYFFPSSEPSFGPASVRIVRNAQSQGVYPGQPPPLDRLDGVGGEVATGAPPWATPLGGISRYLVLASHPDVVPPQQLAWLLSQEKARLSRALDALCAIAASRGLAAGVRGDQIGLESKPGQSYREMDLQWRWLRDEAAQQAGFTRTEVQEYVWIMQVIDALAQLSGAGR